MNLHTTLTSAPSQVAPSQLTLVSKKCSWIIEHRHQGMQPRHRLQEYAQGAGQEVLVCVHRCTLLPI